MKKLSVVLVSIAALSGFASPALAQSAEQGAGGWLARPVAASVDTIELTFSSGYSQPFGMVERGLPMPSLARPGIGFDLGLGYRWTERWSLGLATQYSENLPERSESTRSFVAGLAATYHFLPERRMDPWLEMGTGYRFLWENSLEGRPSTVWHGFRIATARLGLDVRATSTLAFAPFIGADANVFLWRAAVSAEGVPDPRPNTFVYAGVQFRLDAGGGGAGRAGRPAAPARIER